MTTRRAIQATVMGLVLMAGCSKKTGGEPTGDSVPPTDTPAPATDAGRPAMTTAECEAKAGRVVGDIGDGAIHRPDYTCEGGKPPIGTIKPGEGEPVAVEGAVCCPAAA